MSVQAACCESNLCSVVFYGLGLKAQQSKHRLESSALIRATREARMDRSWEEYPLGSFDSGGVDDQADLTRSHLPQS
jgi:hypothetical protein